MSEINIRVEPGQIIEIGGKRYEAVAFRCPVDGDRWLAAYGEALDNGPFIDPRLILRRLPTRKVPTDQDAAVWPRRKCWVRDDENEPWEEAVLLVVTGDCSYPFRVFQGDCETDLHFRFCEIEAEE